MRVPVAIGTWQMQTNASTDCLGVWPFQQKLDTMKNVITRFYSSAGTPLNQAIQAYNGTNQAPGGGAPAPPPAALGTPLYIFVAPEYYFKKTLGERCLTKAERDTFVTDMSQLAQSKPDLLLVPGTVMWKDSGDKALNKAKKRLMQRSLQPMTAGQAKMVEAKRDLLRTNTKLVNGELQSQIDWVAYNTAYIFYNNTKYKYHKMNDFSELAAGDMSTMFIHGSARGVYDIGPFKVGIEICGDHEEGTLQAGDAVDIHIVTSAAVSKKDAHVRAKDGGFFVHAASINAEAWIVDNAAGLSSLNKASSVNPTDRMGSHDARKQEVTRRIADLKQKGMTDDSAVRNRPKIEKEVIRDFGGSLTIWTGVLDT